MPVTSPGGQGSREVVAGVVAEHVDPDEALRVLHDLEERGFWVVPVSGSALAAASRIALQMSAREFPRRLELGLTTIPGLHSAELAGVMAGTVAAMSALTRSMPRSDLLPGLSAEQLQPAFDAVVDAVTRPTVPPPAWFAQARRNAEARQAFLDEFGALTSDDIASLAGSQATNRRATAHRWQAEHKIFAVNHHGQVLYPGFQFDPEVGRPKPAVAETLAALPEAMTGWALALWWTTPVDLLDWARPVDVLDTATEELVRAAQAEAADWAQAAASA